MPPRPNGVAMAAMESALTFLEEGTGFLVALALEIVAQIGWRVGGQPGGEVVQSREERAQIGLGLAVRHAPRRFFQFQQRVKYFVLDLRHKRFSNAESITRPREKSMAKSPPRGK